MSKIGLYFGSFNPIHIGHVAIAGYMVEFSDLDEVWFVVSPHNPLKKKSTLLDDSRRLDMVDLALGDSLKLRSCDIEFHLPKPSYTINTLVALMEKFPFHEFCLIMGEDNVETLYKWKNIEQLLTMIPIYVYPRKYVKDPQNQISDDLLAKANMKMVDAPIIEISGSFIRDAIKQGKDVSYFLPSEVWKYIDKKGYYR